MDNRPGASPVPQSPGRDEQLQNNILAALDQRQFFICLQPRFFLPARKIIGAEVLLRWNEPDGGIIFPAEFIPSAERAGLVELLDLYALESAAQTIRRWLDEKMPAVALSVNLSSSSLHTPGFINAVSDCVMKYHVPPDMLEFEFSMQFMRDYPAQLSRAVEYFHELGYRCAVDGFVQKRPALSQVRAFALDAIKINCRAYASEQESEEGLRACIDVYHAAERVRMEAVCEGVETPYELTQLAHAGCQRLQGYALSMPVSIRMFERLLKNCEQ